MPSSAPSARRSRFGPHCQPRLPHHWSSHLPSSQPGITNSRWPAAAAVREVREETGLEVLRLYNVRVQPFYLHRSHTVQLSVVFAAFADPSAPLTLGTEHTAGEWVNDDDALARLFWPGDRQSLREALTLLADGTAGGAEDVLPGI